MDKAPTAKQFMRRLSESLAYCMQADDTGSIDFEMSRWQEWVKTWPPILDEEGGL